METEIWKDITGFNGMYRISNYGNVMSTMHWGKHRIKILKLNNVRGYRQVGLVNSLGYRRFFFVHRLVAQGFLGLDINSFINLKISLCVCHKDDNPSNNRVDNLFLGTQADINGLIHT